MKAATTLILALMSLAFTSTATADVVKIGVGQQAKEEVIERPVKGSSKARVQELYGNPLQAFQAIGEPPISRWVFDRFTVYFEYDHVVHSVVHHKPNP